MFERSVFLVAALCALVGLGACSNDPYPGDDSEKKIFYTSFSEPPKTLDPAVSYNVNEHTITAQIMDTLLEYHYLERPYRLIPGLATEVPQAETLEDGRVRYRFRLRPDLRFQDDPCFTLSGESERGRELTAEDVAFELMRLADPDVNSPVYQSFLLVDGFAAFNTALAERRKIDAGFAARPVHEQYAELGTPKGIVLPDPLTLEIMLTEPYPQILYWFAMQFTTPVPWEAIQYYDGLEGRPEFSQHPVGSGPFFISLYDKRLKIVLEKNPNWYGVLHPEWQAEAATYPSTGEAGDDEHNLDQSAVGKPLPFLERVEFRLEKEPIPRFGKFLQGYYDLSAVINESYDMVIQDDALSDEMRTLGVSLKTSVVPDIRYIAFNMSDKVVGRPAGERAKKLRQAMSLVIDVHEYLRVFANGRGIPAQSPLPPGIFGYDGEYKNPFRHEVDVERAKQLLIEAGYPGGIDKETNKPLRLTFDTGNTAPAVLLQFEFFVRAWRRLGLNVVVDASNYNQFQDKMRRNAYQIFYWGWIGDYPDPENFLFLLWGEASPHPNSARFENERYDALFLQMKARGNDDERMRLIREMIGIIEEERPWIELFHSEEYALIHSWVKNVKPTGLSLPAVKYRDVDPAQRVERRKEWNQPVLWPAFLFLGILVVAIVPGVVTFFRERQ